jgi:hypothetical protein
MIGEVDEAILSSLKKGLSGQVPEENIVLGQATGKKGVCLENTNFTIEEAAMGSVSEVKREEMEESFDADGKSKAFKLSRAPVNELLFVETPAGTVRFQPDDYFVDRQAGVITFRDAPKKGSGTVRIKYNLSTPVGESRFLKFALRYAVTIKAESLEERDRMTLAAIEALYRDMPALAMHGVEDIRLLRGYTVKSDAAKDEDEPLKLSILQYDVQASLRIDTGMSPMGKIEIRQERK